MKNEIKIIIAGGGTGGHIFPAISIAGAIKRLCPQASMLFIGAEGKMEMEKVPQAGYKIEGLTIAGFNRSNMFNNLSLPYKLLKSFVQVRNIFSRFKPNAVVGVGGYSSYPVLRYAQLRGIPTFIHEANSFGGKSNIMLSKKAVKVFTGSDGMEKFFPASKILVTGNPVRQSIIESNISREQACIFFGLNPLYKTVLSVGGSLGAKSINDTLNKNISAFTDKNIQLIWQTGKSFDKKEESIKGVYQTEFITKMEYAYAAADVVISRSGAMAVAELCVAKKASVLVPYPFAAEDHQTANAMRLVIKEAALTIPDSMVGQELVPAVLNLVMNEELQKKLEHNIEKIAIKNADEIIAEEILKSINEN